MIIWAHQAAPKPKAAARVWLSSEAPAAAKPSTVAGPTKGPARALAATPETLTRPEIAATTGVVASCAASGTVIDSATTRGSQRLMIMVQRWDHQTMPAQASTDK